MLTTSSGTSNRHSSRSSPLSTGECERADTALQFGALSARSRYLATLAPNVPRPEQNLLGIAAGLLLQRVLPLPLPLSQLGRIVRGDCRSGFTAVAALTSVQGWGHVLL
jgi:hypothetical protein